MKYKRPFLRRSGRNSKVAYYLRTSFYALPPTACLKRRYHHLMDAYQQRTDKAIINQRVDYYCQLDGFAELVRPQILKQLSKSKDVYHRDFYEYSRYFNSQLRVCTAFGDNTQICPCPSIVKS